MRPDFSRYGCQIALPGFNEQKQTLLNQAKVLIIGAGGLGCPVAIYLNAAGVGTIGIADYDVVTTSNLHRQVLYGESDIGKKKAEVAIQLLEKQNNTTKLIQHDVMVTSENILELIANYDVLVDCTDNFETRYLINDAAVITCKPLVYGAIYQYEGQVAVWNVQNEESKFSPNYRDLYPEVDASQIPNCAEGGVIPTLAGIIGCAQANEVIKLITKTGGLLAGKLFIFNALNLESQVIKIGTVTRTTITQLKPTATTPFISVKDLKQALEDNSIQLFDIRTQEERDSYHIGGKHVILQNFEAFFESLPQDTKKVLYCASGKRSDEMVKTIKQKHPEANIFSLKGGLNAWIQEKDIA
jgi:adenylyltransferase/sulfurtransferase